MTIPSAPTPDGLSRSPFRATNIDRAEDSATLTGSMPPWLKGDLVRTAPAIFETATWKARHWFDGLGMLYAFRLGGGTATYRSHLLESEVAKEAQGGRAKILSFDTPTSRNWLERIFQPIGRITDNANVNIVAMGNEWTALTESPHQLSVDPKTLAVRGRVQYTEDDMAGDVMIAHPQYDRARNLIVGVAIRLGASPRVRFYSHAPNSRTRTVIAEWKSPRLPYVHSFAMTENYVVLIVHPFTIAPVKLLWKNNGFIRNFDWRPADGTKLVVCNRSTGEVKTYETDPFFTFHTAHAFERNGELVVDLVAYDDASIISRFETDALNRLGAAEFKTHLRRLEVPFNGGAVRVRTISDVPFEFPTVSSRWADGREAEHIWGATAGRSTTSGSMEIVKIRTKDGHVTRYGERDYYFGEPVFVRDPEGTTEEDGVILSVGSHVTKDEAKLVVLDARTMDQRAAVTIAAAIPLGFHGSFVRQAD